LTEIQIWIRLIITRFIWQVPSIQVDGTFNPFSNETPSKHFLVIKTREAPQNGVLYVGLKQDVFDVEQVTFENRSTSSLLTIKNGACGAQTYQIHKSTLYLQSNQEW
jgi:DNA mismatch repair protein MutL